MPFVFAQRCKGSLLHAKQTVDLARYFQAVAMRITNLRRMIRSLGRNVSGRAVIRIQTVSV